MSAEDTTTTAPRCGANRENRMMDAPTNLFTNARGDIYRAVQVGRGYGIALWNAHYQAWMGEPLREFRTKKDAKAEAQRRAAQD